MKIIQKKFVNYILFPNYSAINLFGILFVKPRVRVNDVLINHESIHTEQIKEVMAAFAIPSFLLSVFVSWWFLILLFGSFYIWYFVEWIINLIRFKCINLAYRRISFEREAYTYQYKKDYLKQRKIFAFLDYVRT